MPDDTGEHQTQESSAEGMSDTPTSQPLQQKSAQTPSPPRDSDVPISQPLQQLLSIATAQARMLGWWLLLPSVGFMVLIYAAVDGDDGLHVVTGVLTFLTSVAAALIPRTPRIKAVERAWLILPLAGSVAFLYLVNQDLTAPWGSSDWWIGVLIFAATIYAALAPQIHSFRRIDLGAALSSDPSVAPNGTETWVDSYDVRMRAIARFTARTMIITAVLYIVAGAVGGAVRGEDLGLGSGGGLVVGLISGGIIAQLWLGFAVLVWFSADIARHTRINAATIRQAPTERAPTEPSSEAQ